MARKFPKRSRREEAKQGKQVEQRAPDPVTPQEWQDAVDFAYVLLLVDSARLYGMITTDMIVNVARCEHILARGANLGYTPAPEVAQRLIRRPG